jgi:hypothetical protein
MRQIIEAVEIYDDRQEATPGAILTRKKPDRLIGTTPAARNEEPASALLSQVRRAARDSRRSSAWRRHRTCTRHPR